MSITYQWHRCFLNSLPFVFTAFLLTAEKEQISKGSIFFRSTQKSGTLAWPCKSAKLSWKLNGNRLSLESPAPSYSWLGQKHCENRQISYRHSGTFLSNPSQNQKVFKKKKSIGSRWRGEHLIFLKAKSFLSFEKRVLGQLLHLTGSSTPLLIPEFTGELCGFLLLVPLVIWVGMVPGFCFPSSLCTFVSPATVSCKSKS